MDIPTKTLAWHLHGAGLENFGDNDAPVELTIRPLKDDEILTRVEAVGLCFSDIKIIRAGGSHLKLWEKDLQKHPLIIGHEAILTILKTGSAVPAEYQPGQRYLIQPDIYVGGRCCAYGYGMDGGYTQFSIIDHRVWKGENGTYLLPCPDNLPSIAAALLEPWTCVRAAYHIPHRTASADNGTTLVVTQPGNTAVYRAGDLYRNQKSLTTVNLAPAAVDALRRELNIPVTPVDAIPDDQFFDDIVCVDLQDRQLGEQALLAAGNHAVVNFLGNCGSDAWKIDVSALHYQNRWYQGTPDTTLDAAYHTPRRAALLPNGCAWFPGGAGAMGQMHVELAIIGDNHPRKILVTDLDDARLEHLRAKLAPRAAEHNVDFILLNPKKLSPEQFTQTLRDIAPDGFTDITVLVPSAAIVDQALPHLANNGLMNIFAGIPSGETSPITVSRIINDGIRFTGSSGSTTQDMRDSLAAASQHEFEPQSAMAAIAGFRALKEGLTAVAGAKFPGKVVLVPACEDMPLIPLEDRDHLPPQIRETLDDRGMVTMKTEQTLHQLWGKY